MMIASRILTLKSTEGDTEIPIAIFAPKHEGDGWSCRYEIDWPEGKESMTAWGFDSIQALVVALQMIGAGIYSSSYHKSGKLMLDAPGAMAFPLCRACAICSKATTRSIISRHCVPHPKNTDSLTSSRPHV